MSQNRQRRPIFFLARMLSTSSVLIFAAVFCVLTLLTLCSLIGSGVEGVKEWGYANAVGIAAFLLYAFGRELPPLLAYEVANGAYVLAASLTLAGFLRFFQRDRQWIVGLLTLGPAIVAAGIACFHYLDDSFAMRTAIVSSYQALICGSIFVLVYQSPSQWRSAYPRLFIIAMTATVVAGSLFRTVLYLFESDTLTSLLDPSPWNVVFAAAGAMVLPMLSLGGIMMVHDRVVTRAERAANRDFLTGAWSRRAFFDVAERELKRAKRLHRTVSLLLIDVDHFKRINDTLGHSTGDAALIELATCSEKIVRAIDYFGRIGGDEFAVLLPDTTMSEALMVAERLRKDFRALNQTVHHTVSIGAANLRDGEDFYALRQRADAALYRAKTLGRDIAVGDDEEMLALTVD